MSAHSIPDLPDGWTVNTNTESHISLVRTDTPEREVVITPAQEQPGWSVWGLSSWSDHPTFATGVTIDDALATAQGVIKAIDTDSSVTNKIRYPHPPSKIPPAESNSDALDDVNNSEKSGAPPRSTPRESPVSTPSEIEAASNDNTESTSAEGEETEGRETEGRETEGEKAEGEGTDSGSQESDSTESDRQETPEQGTLGDFV